MRIIFCLALMAMTAIGCDSNRVYENNIDFKNRSWKIAEPAQFEFQITDTLKKYNLLMDVRNSIDYPYARLFVNYDLKKDSVTLSKELLSVYLFEQKTGKPLGTSGIGDIYDHQFFIMQNYSFRRTGKYNMSLQQFMRQDTIPGILAVGLRVEVAGQE